VGRVTGYVDGSAFNRVGVMQYSPFNDLYSIDDGIKDVSVSRRQCVVESTATLVSDGLLLVPLAKMDASWTGLLRKVIKVSASGILLHETIKTGSLSCNILLFSIRISPVPIYIQDKPLSGTLQSLIRMNEMLAFGMQL